MRSAILRSQPRSARLRSERQPNDQEARRDGKRGLTPYAAGRRDYPALSVELRAQLEAIPASFKNGLRPCQATLHDGRIVDRVYVQDAQVYIDEWGVWPDDDHHKLSIDLADVRGIADSPTRLPPPIAWRLYEAGESGMGYTLFTLVFADDWRQSYVCGNAVDWVIMPTGRTTSDIREVLPHEGSRVEHLVGENYFWCLHGSGSWRWSKTGANDMTATRG
jgi:hypothetical protein